MYHIFVIAGAVAGILLAVISWGPVGKKMWRQQLRLQEIVSKLIFRQKAGEYTCVAVGRLWLLELPWCFLVSPGLHIIIFRFGAYGTGFLLPEFSLCMS